MSLLTPERVPVKVYKWDDDGAPALDKTAGCMMTIFKACLVTGYGTKEGAGWTMPFEDTASGVKVLRPEVGPHTDFYLRLSADTGTEMAAQVYLNMTDANTGDLKLQCTTPFKYAKGGSTGKWLLVATNRSFWFFCEQSYNGLPTKTGAYFFAGDVAPVIAGARAVFLQHSGGTNGGPAYANVVGFRANIEKIDGSSFAGGSLLIGNDVTPNVRFRSAVSGQVKLTDTAHLSDVFLTNGVYLYLAPGLYMPTSGPANNNYDVVDVLTSVPGKSVVHGTGGDGNGNAYVLIDSWSY